MKNGRVMSKRGSPSTTMKNSRVSGVLRSSVTQAVPNTRSGLTGETRKLAISTPSTRASTALTRNSERVPRKPSQ